LNALRLALAQLIEEWVGHLQLRLHQVPNMTLLLIYYGQRGDNAKLMKVAVYALIAWDICTAFLPPFPQITG
jgi:hypothetical protein